MDAAPSPVAITDDSFLSPTGALLSADTERVSDGLLFQLLGKVGRRRPVPYANVLLAEGHPPETIKERIPSGRKHKIPQKRIDISLISAII